MMETYSAEERGIKTRWPLGERTSRVGSLSRNETAAAGYACVTARVT